MQGDSVSQRVERCYGVTNKDKEHKIFVPKQAHLEIFVKGAASIISNDGHMTQGMRTYKVLEDCTSEVVLCADAFTPALE